MFQGRTIAVVVPAYNEERLVARAVGQIPGYVDHVIVVDDASTDRTWEAVSQLERPGLVRVRHDRNGGVGAAIVTGYSRALTAGAEVVAVMAGDAQMDPADLPGLLAPVMSGEADYAKGDRLSWPGVFKVMPFLRFAGNHVFSVLTRITSGYRFVRDSQCGYTAVSARMLTRLDLKALYARYGFPNDMLAHLNAAGARLAQVPVRPIYGTEVSGISLTTALFRVPLVLLRSFLHRKRKALAARRPLLDPVRPEG
ncbi:MAG: glycosyltransferase family 2 protein [Deltaproteobacteria bacterium]|nr:glycosyltransferase family 2 protein [Deltaproteobacteria bacterium]